MPEPSGPPRAALFAGRIAIAAVWVYEGLIAKIVGARADETAIIASVPFLPDGAARLGDGLARHGLRDNRFAWRLLAGIDDPHWRLARTDQVQLVLADVVEHLEQVPAGHYTGISLSNVLDGAGPAFVQRLRAAATRALAPDGAIVLRSFGGGGRDRDPGWAGEDASMIWGSVRVITPPG